jgi:release factor glutamine methyltransferase
VRKRPSLLSGTEERLAVAGCLAAAAEAEELVVAAPDAATLERWVTRREAGEPLAWVTGMTEFCGQAVLVEPGVYVPRPQSEGLARRAAGLAGRGRAADLCTGSGAVAAHLARGGCPVVGVDVDERAVRCARRNGVPAVRGDLGAPLRRRSFTVVTAVAPYVPTGALGLLARDVRDYEPPLALDGGEDGLRVLRRVVEEAAQLLVPGGWLLVELGGDEDRQLASELASAGFEAVRTWCDEEGELRGLRARVGAGTLSGPDGGRPGP